MSTNDTRTMLHDVAAELGIDLNPKPVRQPVTTGTKQLLKDTINAVFKDNYFNDAPPGWTFDTNHFENFQTPLLLGPDSYVGDTQGVWATWVAADGVRIEFDHFGIPQMLLADAQALHKNLTIVLAALDAQGIEGRK